MSATTSSATSASAAAAAEFNAFLATYPALPAPSGQTTNFVNPPSQQPAIIAVCAVVLFFTLTFVPARLYANIVINRCAGLEDYFCAFATCLSIAYMGFILDLSHVQRHMWDVPAALFLDGQYWKLRYAQNNIVAWAFFTSRLPILLLYLRVFGITKSFRYAVYVGFFADALVYLCNVPLLAIFCAPPPGGSWALTFKKCERIRPLAIAQGSCNILLDIYILVLPIKAVWSLRLSYRKKLGVTAIFATGLFAIIASTVSLYYRYQLTYGADVNWNEGAFVASAAVEINTAIICSSMPACSSFLKHILNGKGWATFSSLFSLKSSRFTSTNQSDYKNSASTDHYPRETASGTSRTHVRNQNYMELQESVQARDHHVQEYPEQGIRKTVDVNIV